MISAEENLVLGRIRLLNNRPYLAAVILAMRPRPVDGSVFAGGIGIGVDKWGRLYYDPEKLATYDVVDVAGLLYHEAMHLLRDHQGRCDSIHADQLAFNIAGDLEINDDLREEEATERRRPVPFHLPDQGIWPEKLSLEPWLLAEEYYQTDAVQKFAQAYDCGSGAGGERREWEDAGPSDTGGDFDGITKGQLELARRQVAEQILERAKRVGDAPAGLQRWAEELIDPTVPWRRILAGAIRASYSNVAGMVDYSYQRISRRQSLQPNIILPALRRPVPEVALVIDTSGSMSENDLTACLSEVQGVLKTIGTSAVVISVDTEAHVSGRAHSAKSVRLVGGGGTDMGTGILKAASLRPKPHICIVLTDGETPWPTHAPRDMRVIVASTSQEKGPSWARTVHIDMKDARR